MRPKAVTYSLLVVVLVILIFVWMRRQEPRTRESFDRSPDSLQLSQLARCRMNCLDISQNEINEIMEHGLILLNQSNRRERPCPTFALQGATAGGKKIRVIFAQCPRKTWVIDCFNMKKDRDCHCPGEN